MKQPFLIFAFVYIAASLAFSQSREGNLSEDLKRYGLTMDSDGKLQTDPTRLKQEEKLTQLEFQRDQDNFRVVVYIVVGIILVVWQILASSKKAKPSKIQQGSITDAASGSTDSSTSPQNLCPKCGHPLRSTDKRCWKSGCGYVVSQPPPPLAEQ